jgi:phosphoglycolate phosphatase
MDHLAGADFPTPRRVAGAKGRDESVKPQFSAQRFIEHFDLQPFFEAVYGPDLAGKLDDKRDLLRHALGEHGIDPASAVMIGDRAQDVHAALANRMRALGVLYGYGSKDELQDAGAHALCESVALLGDSIDALAQPTAALRKIEASS